MRETESTTLIERIIFNHFSILKKTCVFPNRSGEKGHILVGGEESHELWHLDDLNLSTFGDIEVSEGSCEVGIEIFLLLITGETLMGSEDFRGSGSSGGLVHHEVSVWGSILVLTFESVGLDHRSHEE